MSKGSTPRPYSVPKETFDQAFDRIFGKKQCQYCEDFFSRYRCNQPDECDCPKCQGFCKCKEQK